MREVIVTKENEGTFEWPLASATSLLRTIDELLHAKDLELVMGNVGRTRYPLRVDKCKVDEEYDADRTRRVLHKR